MRKNIFPRWQITELPFSLLVLFILVWFTYGILFKAPYSGFDFNTSDGQVSEIFVKPEQEPSLQAGDISGKNRGCFLAGLQKKRQTVFL